MGRKTKRGENFGLFFESAARMPKRRKPWSTTEESALSRGIKKHGLGQWKKIQDDGELFADGRSFTACGVRSNVDLKDKWRNMLKSKAPGGEAEEGTAPSRSDISPNITTTATSNSFRAGVTAKLPKATPMPSYEPQATSASSTASSSFISYDNTSVCIHV